MKTTPKKAGRKKHCTQEECKKEATQAGFCRLHYLANWKRIRLASHIKAERRLNAYVDRLAKKYPEDYMNRLKESLEDDDKFKQAVEELELENENDSETEREFLEKFERSVKGED